MDVLLFLKAFVSISIVVIISLVAERSGPRVAGLLLGMPLGAGMVVIFTGLEQGVGFAAEAAVHMVPGFVTTIVFIYFYGLLAAKQNRGGVRGIVLPSIVANAMYGAAAWIMSLFQLALYVSVPFIAVCILIGHWIMSQLPDTPITNRVKFGWGVLAFRAGMATLVIIFITAVADRVGPQWTGILTAYPITLFPSILVLHITYAGNEVAAVLKHIPYALGCVTTFCLVVVFALPAFGLWWGTLLAYALAAAYLLGYSTLARWLRGRKRPTE